MLTKTNLAKKRRQFVAQRRKAHFLANQLKLFPTQDSGFELKSLVMPPEPDNKDPSEDRVSSAEVPNVQFAVLTDSDTDDGDSDDENNGYEMVPQEPLEDGQENETNADDTSNYVQIDIWQPASNSNLLSEPTFAREWDLVGQNTGNAELDNVRREALPMNDGKFVIFHQCKRS